MPKTPDEITALVCAPHCRFFKAETKEDLACAGYDFFADRLTRDQAKKLAERFISARPPQNFLHHPAIEQVLCAVCPFREQDCDFMSPTSPENAVPCGGYALLALLLEGDGPEPEFWQSEIEKPHAG